MMAHEPLKTKPDPEDYASEEDEKLQEQQKILTQREHGSIASCICWVL
jgi:hypothetical protein